MHPVIHFRSQQIDVSQEPGNPINPIRGASLLEWLRSRVPADLAMTAPEPEDWGWYSQVDWQGRTYMLGASVNESHDGNHDWALQFDKVRSFKERLLGQAKLLDDDACVSYFRTLMANEPTFTDFSIEWDS